MVRVALPVPLYRNFDYAVPGDQTCPVAGSRVRVPFGKRELVGICVLPDPPDPFHKLQPVLAVLDDIPALNADLLMLARWLADYYHYPLGEVFSVMLPKLVQRGAPLAPPMKTIWQRTDAAGELGRAPRQRALLELIERQGGRITADEARAAGFSKAPLQALVGKGLLQTRMTPGDLAEPVSAMSPEAPAADLRLTPEQAAVVSACSALAGDFSVNLLEGVTGSGKTEVYLQLLKQAVTDGGQALVLVPEIALTPQMVSRFQQRYRGTATLHSGMTPNERLATWLNCRAGQVAILIGTRSAVFTPFADLRLIIVDEEHDPAFKQQDRLRYSARDLAIKRARDSNIPLLLGSATPSLESLENVRRGRYQRQALTVRATGAPMPTIRVLDIRGHRLQDGISPVLLRRIRRHLEAGNQVMVFLNRRGYAPTWLCQACGWQARCDACDARMTLHLGARRLRCHHCGAERRLLSSCPACQAEDLIAVGVGTERTEAGLRQRFAEFPLIRIDRDTTRGRNRLQAQLAKAHTGEPGILLGTQMLAKGHHFPNLTLVAAVNADAGLLCGDFKAPERTAQLLIQVAGRAGRAARPGDVWIQSLHPENPALQRLVEHGYAGFARHELGIRRQSGMPPSRHLAMIRASAKKPEPPQRFLATLKAALPDTLEVLGPAPAPMPRLAGRYRSQLMVLADRRGPLHRGLDRVTQHLAPAGVRWEIDVDPVDAG